MDISKYPELSVFEVELESHIYDSPADAIEMFLDFFTPEAAKKILKSLLVKYVHGEKKHPVEDEIAAEQFNKSLNDIVKKLDLDKNAGRQEIAHFFLTFPLPKCREFFSDYLESWMLWPTKLPTKERHTLCIFYQLINVFVDSIYIIDIEARQAGSPGAEKK